MLTNTAGGLHGSSKLNRCFWNFFVKHLGRHMDKIIQDTIIDFDCASEVEAKQRISTLVENGFEVAKKGFKVQCDAHDDENFMVELPGMKPYTDVPIKAGCIEISRSDFHLILLHSS